MKLRALVTALAISAGIAGPGLAFEYSTSAARADRLIQTVSCNVKDDDKQARCAAKCEDQWIMSSQGYGDKDDPEKAKTARKECDAKCGC